MRHRMAGRKLGRTSEHRIALLRNLSTQLLEKERITTTLAKAKEVRRFTEKLVTMSKRETLHARRHVLRHIHNRDVVAKLFDTLSARYAQRPGGYTRVFKLGPRRGDNAEMALIELVGAETAAERPAPEPREKPRRKSKAADDSADAKEAKAAKPATKKKTAKKTTAKKKSTKKKSTKKAATKKAAE